MKLLTKNETIKTAEKVAKAKRLLSNVGNRIFSATHIKRDGSIRKGEYRLHVKYNGSGQGMKYDPKSLDYLPVYELQNASTKDGERRIINLATLQSLTIDGNYIQF